MNKELNTRIKSKKDSTSNWKDSSTILLNGELAVEESSNGQIKIKVGDGVNSWNNLDYITSHNLLIIREQLESDESIPILSEQFKNINIDNIKEGKELVFLDYDEKILNLHEVYSLGKLNEVENYNLIFSGIIQYKQSTRKTEIMTAFISYPNGSVSVQYEELNQKEELLTLHIRTDLDSTNNFPILSEQLKQIKLNDLIEGKTTCYLDFDEQILQYNTYTKKDNDTTYQLIFTNGITNYNNGYKVEILSVFIDYPSGQFSFFNTKLNDFNYIQNKPSTLSGYGITDSYTKTEVNEFVGTDEDNKDFDYDQLAQYLGGTPGVADPFDTAKISIKGNRNFIKDIFNYFFGLIYNLKMYLSSKDASISITDVDNITNAFVQPKKIKVNISNDVNNALSLASDGLKVTIPEQEDYTVQVTESSPEGYIKAYTITQVSTGLNTTINIPKDMVVQSGTVEKKDTSGAWGLAGTYLVLTLANSTNDKIYIDVSTLIEYVTSGSTTNDIVQIAISQDHKVTGTIKDGSITHTQLDAITNAELVLAADSESKRIKILTAGTNIDELTIFQQNASWMYIVDSASLEGTFPDDFTKPGYLIVKKGDNSSSVQILFTKDNIYTRFYNSTTSTWSSWKKNNESKEYAIKNNTTSLTATKWTSDGVYDFTDIYPSNQYNIEISLDSTATNAQYSAYANAKMVGSSTTNQLKAFGLVPTIDIPVFITYYKIGG